MADFIHLHNHSDFSLQDGAQSVQMLCDRCDDLIDGPEEETETKVVKLTK